MDCIVINSARDSKQAHIKCNHLKLSKKIMMSEIKSEISCIGSSGINSSNTFKRNVQKEISPSACSVIGLRRSGSKSHKLIADLEISWDISSMSKSMKKSMYKCLPEQQGLFILFENKILFFIQIYLKFS